MTRDCVCRRERVKTSARWKWGRSPNWALLKETQCIKQISKLDVDLVEHFRISQACNNNCMNLHIAASSSTRCCFYYFVRNSLVALLEALCARIFSFRFVHIGFVSDFFLCVCVCARSLTEPFFRLSQPGSCAWLSSTPCSTILWKTYNSFPNCVAST